MVVSNSLASASDDLLQRCWRQQDCGGCLREKSCGWCASSTVCVPNTNKIPILAPIWDHAICPSEHWELRARPLGCQVSTITFFASIVSILSTFVVIGLVAIAVKATRALQPKWRERSDGWWKIWQFYQPGWWKGWRIRLVDVVREDEVPEQRPLLG